MVPFAMELLPAAIAIDRNTAALTVSVKELDVIPFWEAVMVLDPAATPVASPLAFIGAAEGFEEFQTTELVRFWVLPSLKVPVAVN